VIANLSHYDLDGVVCHILLRNLFPKLDVRYYTCGYDKLQEKITKLIDDKEIFDIHTVFVTDLSITCDQAKLLKENFNNVFLFDHHETSYLIKDELHSILHNTYINKTMCGSALVFRAFEEKLKIVLEGVLKDLPEMSLRFDRLKRLVEVTNIYDMWQLHHEQFSLAYYLNDCFWIYRWEQFVDKYIRGFEGFNTYETMTVYGRLKEKTKLINEADKSVFGKNKNAIFIVTTEAERITNEITIALQDYEYYFVYNPESDKLSIRVKNKNKNLAKALEKLESPIVKEAGGHRFAGGLVLKKDLVKKDLLEALTNEIYDELENQVL
jgi:oligoribonuclease NrnB/cAMP/cGMP phosphodiesterase (DHH superfamily)